ncbi:PRAME family member 12-like [Nannospalax galili]|uniref:PRAME family member 12-like n=1 Tax=Nannospalax galili TaxID=1026970 RepID=UPI00111C517A|nr:PRAME family member 12-like [Nannospalax galili]
MSYKVPPTLLSLAMQNLLRDQASSMSALNDLPMELFPALFMDVFMGRHTKILKAMMAAWPFPCLPVGALMKTPHMQTLQALLRGLDMLIAQKVRLRRCKLLVLDLRTSHNNFWDVWTGREDGSCSTQGVRRKQRAMDFPKSSLRQRMKVLVDIAIRFHLDKYQTYFLQWAQQRKNYLQLCCIKMQIQSLPIYTIRNVFKVFQLESTEELELSADWNLSTLAQFAVNLGQLRNLHKLSLALIYKSTPKGENTYTVMEKRVTKFIYHFSKLVHLQHLYMNEVYFLNGHTNKLFGCLKTPLQTLCVTHCHLSLADLNHLAQSQILSQLKHLDLSATDLFHLSPRPLQVLLERVASTLQTLELKDCRMEDTQLHDLLPALSQCAQLTQVNFLDNSFSMASLKDLFHHTASLSQLSLELYPAPQECYDDAGNVLLERLDQLCHELVATLRDIRQPKTVYFASAVCLNCFERCVFELVTKPCVCWQ